MWREAAVLAVTALVCASTLAAVKLRHSRFLTESTASLLAAPKAMHLPPPPPTSPGEGPLVHASNLVYEGAFRLPPDTINETSFAYGGTALAFNRARQSLFIVGHDWQQRVAEIGIPDIRSSSSVRGLAAARVIQPFTDATEGAMGKVGPNTVKVGGLLLFRDQLYLSAYLYYDGTGGQLLSHFVTSPDLSVRGEVRGPYQVGTLGAGFVSGYFGDVPARWQEALGGPVLNGNCCLGVISRTSFGPALFAIDPQKIGGGAEPAPATALVYYPSKHPLAPGDTESPLFNLTSEVKGVIFHEGTRSVLFFGRHGLGPYCYGPGTADRKVAGQPADGGVDRWCFDPASDSKGTHAFPYSYYVWAYDANELATVKAGRRAPWEVKPYEVWSIALPFSSSGSAVLNGAAYDAATGRIFVSQAFGDGERPLIHVLSIRFS